MFKKKIIKGIMIMITVSMGLCACGGNTSKDIKDNKKISTNDDNNKKKNTPCMEILEAEKDSGMIQIGNDLIQLPITVKEFVSLGYEINVAYEDENYLLSPNSYYALEVKKDGNILFYVDESEYKGDKICKVSESDMIITEINVISTIDEYVVFPKGITFESTYADVEEKYGELENDYTSFTYKYGMPEYCGLSVCVSPDTGLVYSGYVSKKVESITFDDFDDKYTKNVVNYVSGASVNVTRLAAMGDNQTVPVDSIDAMEQSSPSYIISYDNELFYMSYNEKYSSYYSDWFDYELVEIWNDNSIYGGANIKRNTEAPNLFEICIFYDNNAYTISLDIRCISNEKYDYQSTNLETELVKFVISFVENISIE